MKKIILAFSVMLLDCLWIVTSPHFGMNQIIGLIILLGVTGYLLIKLQRANYKFNPNKPGIFQWQSVDDVFLMVVD